MLKQHATRFSSDGEDRRARSADAPPGRRLPRRRTARLALVALTAALTIAACGDDDDSGVPAKPEKLAIEVTEQRQGKFRLSAPGSVQAGLVEISLRPPAGEATHDAQLVRVVGDHTRDEVVATVSTFGAPIPRWLIPAGGVGQTGGDAIGRTVKRLEPGKYFILDTDEPEGDNVKSYAETGATAALEVTGEPGTAELPQTDANVTAKDYTFAVSDLKAGKNEIAFENAGKQPHHLMAFPYRKGATLDEARTFLTEEGEGSVPPPLDFAGTTRTSTLASGDKQIVELDLKRGKYALVCFLSDREGGPPHAAKGMIVETAVE
jgi:hypothetical protein